jgi:hypothetical protein
MITAGLDSKCGSFPSACSLVNTSQYTDAREAPHPGSTTVHSSSETYLYFKFCEDVTERDSNDRTQNLIK